MAVIADGSTRRNAHVKYDTHNSQNRLTTNANARCTARNANRTVLLREDAAGEGRKNDKDTSERKHSPPDSFIRKPTSAVREF
jgi:hypothetical protein